ncbi:MAG: polysaccharide biosynthesis tyrosine autokinase [bacterium]
MDSNNINSRDFETNSLKDYINIIRLNLLPILLIAITGLVVSIVYAVNARDIYKSTTILKLAKPQGSILDSPLIPEFQDFGSDRFIANEIEVLKSYTIKEKVANALIEKFNTIGERDSFYLILDQSFKVAENKSIKIKSIEQIISFLELKVAIEQKRGLDIVEITVESPSPFEASLIANLYADAYKQLNLQINRAQLTSVKEFLSSQRNEKLNELSNAEEILKKFQEEKGIVELPAQASALIQQLTDFESKQNAAKIELIISERNLKSLKSEMEKQDPRLNDYLESFAAEPYLKNLQESIATLEAQRDLALANNQLSKNSAITVSDFDKRIKELKEKLNQKISVYKAGLFASSPVEIKELSKQILEEELKYQGLVSMVKQLDIIVKGYEKNFNELPKSTINYARLERERTAFEKLYQLVEEKYQEVLINEQSTPGNVLIIDVARRADEPSKPNRNLIVIVGLVLGIGLGLGFAFMKNYFDNTVKTPEDIQKKNINVLAWVPLIEGIDLKDNEFEFIVAKRPDSIPSEAFRALRTRIQFSKVEKDSIKTILITSSTPREGKTTISVNLSGSFANAGKRTLILDCDLRKPRMHNVFKVKRFPGMTDYFFGQATYEEILRKSEVTNLFYITAGTIPPNPSEILSSQLMLDFIEKIRKEFDIIVLDSPPVIAVTDSEILSRLVDVTLLVVSANQTEVELMTKATELLSHDHGSFVGVILNNFSYKSGYGSYYKYYYYYSRPAATNKPDKKLTSGNNIKSS